MASQFLHWYEYNKIVMNTFANGEWGKEERKSLPIKKGDSFDIRIRAHDDRFQIVIDQKEFKDYEHRLPLTSITHLSIDGDLYLNHVHWGGKYYPVPYESGIASGFPIDKTLLIFGTVEKKGKRFNINLLRRNGDIALHFNPRFDEKAVIRNALAANEWGNEEREGKMPFEKGVGFDLAIKNEPYAFQLFTTDYKSYGCATYKMYWYTSHADSGRDYAFIQLENTQKRKEGFAGYRDTCAGVDQGKQAQSVDANGNLCDKEPMTWSE
ncbi:galactoside-binding lectin [Teladorsagia circumcincta]|uniref:Galectin n=1 Tax=Teladorsagia circumcincta TaxID=45464 RepID=A0A2G9TUQ4_TELCI|nr:galactoside-binding lectin [Teladorsagia circumcincta]